MDPHYAKPNVSCTLYDYTGREQELISQAFRAGNFTYLSSLPAFIQPSAVSEALKEKSVESVNRHSKPKPKLCHLWGCDGLVHEFEWMPDSFDALTEQQKREKTESLSKRKQICESDFRPTGIQAKDKHEEGFTSSKVPFLTVNEPYEAATEHASRLKWIQECQLLAGEFRPCLQDHSTSRINRQHVAEILSILRTRLQSDWEDIEVEVDYTADELVEIRVKQASVDSQVALHAYMNVLVNQDETLYQYKMKRVPQGWGLEEEGLIYYTLALPWTRLRTNDATVSLPGSKTSPRGSGPRSLD